MGEFLFRKKLPCGIAVILLAVPLTVMGGLKACADPPPAEALGGAGDAGGEGADEGGGPFKGTIQPAGTQFNPPAPITIPNLSRDLQTDLFFGSGLDLLLPPTAGGAGVPEVGGGGAAPLGGEGTNPLLDPQLDTGSALLDGASLSPLGAAGAGGGGPPLDPALVALHNNFHANQQAALAAFQANQTGAHTASHTQQAAGLAAFQGGQNTFLHDNFHTQQDADHTAFHNLFPPGNPLFGAQHGQFHALQGQADGGLHAQQAADLNAFQGGQQANENALHTQQNVDLVAFQGQQGDAHTDFHNANPGI